MAHGKYAIRESLAHFIEQRLVSKVVEVAKLPLAQWHICTDILEI